MGRPRGIRGEAMRIASYNVENMFERPKVFARDKDWTEEAVRTSARVDSSDRFNDVIGLHAELNQLFAKDVYSSGDKGRMAEIIGALGLRSSDNVSLVTLRVLRGRLLRRPTDKTKPVQIVASGRADWVGWLDLNPEPVSELATDHMAMVIRDSGADIVGVVEADNRVALDLFAQSFLKRVGCRPYEQVMLFDGNDPRGIDVGLLVRDRASYSVTYFRTHIFEPDPDGSGRLFSRDCAEYHITEEASGRTVVVLVNHLKSKGYNSEDDPIGAKQRRRQAEGIAEIYTQLVRDGFDQVAVLGDLNDSPTLDGKPESSLQPLFDTGLKDISEHDGFDPGERLGTFGTGHTLASKIDYILLSPALSERVVAGGIIRSGMWRGPRVRKPWKMYDTLTAEQHAASDHALIWADLED